MVVGLRFKAVIMQSSESLRSGAESVPGLDAGAYSVKDAWPILEFVEQYSQTSESVVVKAGA